MKDKLFLKENFFVEFIGVTLVNKIIQVSSVQFSNTSSVYYIVCSTPKVKFLSLTIIPLCPLLLYSPPRLCRFLLVITIQLIFNHTVV